MDLAFFISHSTSAVKPVYTLLESSYYNCSPQPHLPLPLPVKEQPKFSLPSISTLFRDADGTQHAARKRRQFSPSHHDRDVQIQPYELPPPPPLRSGPGNEHSKSHSPSEPNTKPDTHSHRFSISNMRSIYPPHNTAAPYAPPALTITSHPFPLDVLQPTKYYTCPPATASFQPVMTVTAPQMPQPHAQVQTQQQPRSQSSSAPVTLAWHRHYLPPSNSSLCQKKRGRYICRTCRKAFSCPFWLRTHFHSHTREKSFRCTHPGCGKSFSVRSNMNRHGRGQLF
ncbi:hypothetical protein N7491_000430 [Penicillium cf. griseofulvum]|uniref:C2H2-type domain-containing protein n=1 Tax=Penicillium cf. griseofulvum TaxID=2972120 RepID=A0A9W9JSF7_9EURO|nr:hypothetical protein N7472_004210 [Penicillium cf. griseofulvum]KAJ5451248.1 hypothetical protein N7491_000430 [Penicillium cf. griseofulvum]